MEFDVTMYRLGYEVAPDKQNTIGLTCHNTSGSKKDGFTVSYRTRYKGKEKSLC
jgi:hypothetical protein